MLLYLEQHITAIGMEQKEILTGLLDWYLVL